MGLCENSDYQRKNLLKNAERSQDLRVPYFEHSHISTTDAYTMGYQLHQSNRNVATSDPIKTQQIVTLVSRAPEDIDSLLR